MNRLLLAAATLVTTTAIAEPKIDYQKFTLPNGMDVFVIEDAKAPTVYEVLWVKVGSKDEVLRRFRARAEHADACTPVIPHYGLAQDRIDFYSAGIADLFYSGGR